MGKEGGRMPPEPRLNVVHLEDYHLSKGIVASTLPDSSLHKQHQDKLDFLKHKFPKIATIYQAFTGGQHETRKT